MLLGHTSCSYGNYPLVFPNYFEAALRLRLFVGPPFGTRILWCCRASAVCIIRSPRSKGKVFLVRGTDRSRLGQVLRLGGLRNQYYIWKGCSSEVGTWDHAGSGDGSDIAGPSTLPRNEQTSAEEVDITETLGDTARNSYLKAAMTWAESYQQVS